MEKKEYMTVSGDSLNLFQIYTQSKKNIPTILSESKEGYNRQLIKNITNYKGYLEDFENIQKKLFSKKIEEKGVSFLPLNRLNEGFGKDKYISIIKRIINSGEFTSGPYIDIFERGISLTSGIKNVILCSSGTDALMIALKAVGVLPYNEVIIPPNSFAATENAVLALGAIPVVADIEKTTYNICPKSVESKITSKTKCILPVHLYGKLSPMKDLSVLCKKYRVKMVEDACQAIGLKGIGEYSDCAVVSFNPFKNLGGLGKAGGILTKDDAISLDCHSLSYHGFIKGKKNIKCLSYGFNSRIDNLQAAILHHKLGYLSLQTFKRMCLADRYISALNDLEKEGKILLPKLSPDTVWHLFPIQILKENCRDKVREILQKKYLIETETYYPLLIHQQKTNLHTIIFKNVCLPNAEKIHSRILFLPFHHNLTFTEQDQVVEALTKSFRKDLTT